MSPAPTCVGPYRVVGVLGEGGMGRVYLGDRDGGHGPRVALKVIRSDLARAADATALTRTGSAWPDDVRPGRPPGCTGAFGDALEVAVDGRGDFVRHGDTVLGSGPTLAYGRASRVGGTVWTSRESGVECRVDATRHGFSISRTRYALF